MFSGALLRNLREQRNLTQDALCKRAGIARTTLSRIELGLAVPTLETLIKVGNSIAIPLPKLLGKTGILRK